MLTFDLNFDAVNRNGWNKWRPWEDWSIISSRYIGTWCPWASYEVEQSGDGKLHYAFSLGTILADIWSLPVIKCNSAQTFMNMVLRCHMSRIIYWLRYRASQLSEISFTCDFSVYTHPRILLSTYCSYWSLLLVSKMHGNHLLHTMHASGYVWMHGQETAWRLQNSFGMNA